jgi:hypothetical protein
MEKIIFILKGLLVLLVALFIGGEVNMFIVENGHKLISNPPGTDFTTAEGLKKSMHLMLPKHFVMPFLAHALGTLVAAIIVVKLMPAQSKYLAYLVGLIFFVGGVMMISMVPSPLWFTIVDLVFAYIPMSLIALKQFYKSNEN